MCLYLTKKWVCNYQDPAERESTQILASAVKVQSAVFHSGRQLTNRTRNLRKRENSPTNIFPRVLISSKVARVIFSVYFSKQMAEPFAVIGNQHP